MARILAVDDERLILELYRGILTSQGHQVTCASDGQKGWEIFQANEFDLVITDFNMPNMKGDELAQKVRAKNPKTTIIMISSEIPIENPKLFHVFLPKPPSVASIIAAVNSIWQK